ncbi:flavin-containing monooxygenase [Dickeya ananatis]|uniref:flavin-containing monooxygenase n=1 Tax=Dickeya ananatis TaxID=3061286 RepID=UPI0038911322
MNIHEKRVCIIGGGPYGVSLGKELNQAGIDYDLYEAEADFGGVWNVDSRSGRTYPSLHLISPKVNTQYPDFPMPEDYPHYPSHKLMHRYVCDYARAFGVYEKAHFNVAVTRIEPQGDGWQVELSTGERKFYAFVLVSNGMQREARYPDPAYSGHFSGDVMHSIDYRTPERIKGKRVLIIGAGNSGCDIAVDAVHHCSAVYHSTRRGYYYQPKFINGMPTPRWMEGLGNKFNTREETLAYIQQVFKLAGYDGTDYGLKKPDYPLDASHPIMNSQLLYFIGHGDIHPKGDVRAFSGQTVTFDDGSQIDVDTIIYATGYNRHFPFLDKQYLEMKQGIPDCFLHIVPKNFDNLLFVGYINSATGLGVSARSHGLFVVDYLNAYFLQAKGLRDFSRMKKEQHPDLGQNYYIGSFRHQWEVDLWKFLKLLAQYREVLNGR